MARVFITGGTGFTGPHVVKAFIARGHTVVALCRSEEKAEAVKELGAEVVIGDITSLDIIKEQSEKCDGVVHMAFPLDASFDFAKGAKLERAAMEIMMAALEGSGKVFINTGGTLSCSVPLGSEAKDETYPGTQSHPPMSLRSENAEFALAYKDKGVKSMLVRLSPTVHGEGDKGFIPIWMKIAKGMGAVPYFDEGKNVWTAINKADAGDLFALAYDHPEAGAIWHGVAENLTHKEIAEAMGKKLGLSTLSLKQAEAPEALGMFRMLLGLNAPAKAETTKSKLGWNPTHQGLIGDIQEFYN